MIARATRLAAVFLAGVLGAAAAWPATGHAALPPAGSASGEALAFLEARVAADPLDSIAHNRLSMLYLSMLRERGDLAYAARAEKEARASLAAVPAEQNPGGLVALALALFESHHFTEALAEATRAFELDPRLVTARALMGDCHLELGNYDEARKIFDELAKGPASPSVMARQARLAELSGNDAAALALLEQAGNSDGWYRIRRGELWFRTGQLERAEAEYLAAPESFTQLDHLAELRAAQGRYTEAAAIYKKLAASTGRAEILQAVGDLYAFRERPHKARAWYERARSAYLQSVGQGNAHYLHHLAGFYSDCEQQPEEALRWARKDLEVRRSIQAYDTLAWALYRNKEYTAAAEAMTRALATGTRDVHLLSHAAMIWLRTGEIDKGRATLDEIATLDPAYNRFHVHR